MASFKTWPGRLPIPGQPSGATFPLSRNWKPTLIQVGEVDSLLASQDASPLTPKHVCIAHDFLRHLAHEATFRVHFAFAGEWALFVDSLRHPTHPEANEGRWDRLTSRGKERTRRRFEDKAQKIDEAVPPHIVLIVDGSPEAFCSELACVEWTDRVVMCMPTAPLEEKLWDKIWIRVGGESETSGWYARDLKFKLIRVIVLHQAHPALPPMFAPHNSGTFDTIITMTKPALHHLQGLEDNLKTPMLAQARQFALLLNLYSNPALLKMLPDVLSTHKSQKQVYDDLVMLLSIKAWQASVREACQMYQLDRGQVRRFWDDFKERQMKLTGGFMKIKRLEWVFWEYLKEGHNEPMGARAGPRT